MGRERLIYSRFDEVLFRHPLSPSSSDLILGRRGEQQLRRIDRWQRRLHQDGRGDADAVGNERL